MQQEDVIVWVSTAYLLTSTVPIPIYGKLSDLFGRKPIMLYRSLFPQGDPFEVTQEN